MDRARDLLGLHPHDQRGRDRPLQSREDGRDRGGAGAAGRRGGAGRPPPPPPPPAPPDVIRGGGGGRGGRPPAFKFAAKIPPASAAPASPNPTCDRARGRDGRTARRSPPAR